MSGYTAIELSRLPSPDVVEALSYETILSNIKADLIRIVGEMNPNSESSSMTQVEIEQVLKIESEPLTKLLEVTAYRELLIRQRINDASRSVMLAYATGSNLDHIAALFGISRLTIKTEKDNLSFDDNKTEIETDDNLRRRVQLSLEGHSTAGPEGSYKFWSLSASTEVKDVAVNSPSPGRVEVSVLSKNDSGLADTDLLKQVEDMLNKDDVRPLTDQVSVISAQILPYSVDAILDIYDGPDAEVVRATAEAELRTYVNESHMLGRDIILSAFYAKLHQHGVYKVELNKPARNIDISNNQAAYCSPDNIKITRRE